VRVSLVNPLTMKNDLIERLLKRAEIRRQVQTRKSVREGEPDRIADLLEEAAEAVKECNNVIAELIKDHYK